MKTEPLVRYTSVLGGMFVGAGEAMAFPVVPLAQIPGALRDGFQAGLGIMFLAGFLWGVVKIWNGADKMSKGDADGKMGIIAGIIIAAAAAIWPPCLRFLGWPTVR